MDIESLDNTAREKLEALRRAKADKLLAEQENHIKVYGKAEKNKEDIKARFDLASQVEDLIVRYGVESVHKIARNGRQSVYEHMSHPIPMLTNEEYGRQLLAYAWKTTRRRGKVGLLSDIVTFGPKGKLTADVGITLNAKDLETGEHVFINRFGIYELDTQRLALESDDILTISEVDTYSKHDDVPNLRETLTIIGLSTDMQRC